MWPAYIYQSVYSIHTIHIHIYTYILYVQIYMYTYTNMYILTHTYTDIEPYHRTNYVDPVAMHAEIWHSLRNLGLIVRTAN